MNGKCVLARCFIRIHIKLNFLCKLITWNEGCSVSIEKHLRWNDLHRNVGGGIVIDGKPWSGAHGRAGEMGHLNLVVDGIPCTCGNNGCVERYCSATALIRMAREAVETNRDSLIMQVVGGDPSRIEARTVFDCAREQDALALKLYSTYTDYLAQAIASVVNLLDPEVIVLGGGVSKAGNFLLDPLLAKYPSYVIFNDQKMPEIKLAVLGAKAGIIGAAMLS